MTTANSNNPAWTALARHAALMGTIAHLRDIVAADVQRWQHCHLETGSWLLDVSRQRITRETLELLYGLARAFELPAKIEALFLGRPINTTEGRAVLHTALRSEFAGSAAIQAEVRESRAKLRRFRRRRASRRAARRDRRPFKQSSTSVSAARISGLCWSATLCGTSGAGESRRTSSRMSTAPSSTIWCAASIRPRR
jgi:hypothetical protein